MYPDVSMYIDGAWCKSESERSEPILNPATGDAIGSVPVAGRADLDRALAAADKGFKA
jgi:succinate-semialdehyde dehydrogenase/glutarate-semialdehyde dehydrogenase